MKQLNTERMYQTMAQITGGTFALWNWKKVTVPPYGRVVSNFSRAVLFRKAAFHQSGFILSTLEGSVLFGQGFCVILFLWMFKRHGRQKCCPDCLEGYDYSGLDSRCTLTTLKPSFGLARWRNPTKCHGELGEVYHGERNILFRNIACQLHILEAADVTLSRCQWAQQTLHASLGRQSVSRPRYRRYRDTHHASLALFTLGF